LEWREGDDTREIVIIVRDLLLICQIPNAGFGEGRTDLGKESHDLISAGGSSVTQNVEQEVLDLHRSAINPDCQPNLLTWKNTD